MSRLSEVIKSMQNILETEGDFECFSADFAATGDNSIRVMKRSNGNFPKDWNMPEKFVVLGDMAD